MTMIDGYYGWHRPASISARRLRSDEHFGRGRILLAVMLGCLAFWALVGFAVAQI
jgi:hypothetical protein